MKPASRRKFTRNTSLAVSTLFVGGSILARKKDPERIALSCAPAGSISQSGSIRTFKSGKWSDASTWGGQVPASSDTPVIAASHNISFDVTISTIAGIIIEPDATLLFDPLKSSTLQTTKNIIVLGKLEMHPASASNEHVIRFVDVNENTYVGEGMEVLDTDTGIWVINDGKLDLVGTHKEAWVNADGNILAGTNSISFERFPENWAVGDELTITPTESKVVSGDRSIYGFEDHIISDINNTSVTLNSTVGHDHPKVNDKWTAEVLNLTRNVRVEGTENGKAHIFIRSTKAQIIRYVAMRYMGPRKDINGDNVKELVPGRYCIHFHHCMDGSRGSIVEGCVVRDAGNHSYVPHSSHGITLKGNIAYNVIEIPYWWDRGHKTHDSVWEGNIAASCHFVPRSIAMDDVIKPPSMSCSGFLLGVGDDNVCNNNVAVGTTGYINVGAGFIWQADNDGVWQFENNLAHNNDCGLLVWQVTSKNHIISNFSTYYNTLGIFHGAYLNLYKYHKGFHYGNTVEIKASSFNTARVRFEDIVIDGAGMVDYPVVLSSSPLEGEVPVLLRAVTIQGGRLGALRDNAGKDGTFGPFVKSIDLVQCSIIGEMVITEEAGPKEVIRVQPTTGQPYKITKSGSENIAQFAPAIWGTGTGLAGQYYIGNNFQTLAFKRVDSQIGFQDWWNGNVHNKIQNEAHSVKWTGYIEPQFSEDYTFHLWIHGGTRLWIEDNLVIDKWQDGYQGSIFQSEPIKLEAGRKYNVRMEYYNEDKYSGVTLYWSSLSLPFENIPQSQLYSNNDLVENNTSSIEPLTVTIPEAYTVNNGGEPNTIYIGYGPASLDIAVMATGGAPAYDYKWSNGATSKSIKVSPNTVGEHKYKIHVTDSKGVSKELVHTIKVIDVRCGSGRNRVSVWKSADQTELCVSLPEVASLLTNGYFLGTMKGSPANNKINTLRITASPNPSSNKFRLVINSNSDLPITLSIINWKGTLISKSSVIGKNSTVNIGQNFPRGTYFASVQQGNLSETIQLIKL